MKFFSFTLPWWQSTKNAIWVNVKNEMPIGRAISKAVIVCDEFSKALVLSIKKLACLKNDNKLKLKMIAIVSQALCLTADIFKPNR